MNVNGNSVPSPKRRKPSSKTVSSTNSAELPTQPQRLGNFSSENQRKVPPFKLSLISSESRKNKTELLKFQPQLRKLKLKKKLPQKKKKPQRRTRRPTKLARNQRKRKRKTRRRTKKKRKTKRRRRRTAVMKSLTNERSQKQG